MELLLIFQTIHCRAEQLLSPSPQLLCHATLSVCLRGIYLLCVHVYYMCVYMCRDVPTVVGTSHHSDKTATTTTSLTSTKISASMKMLKYC